MSGIVVLLPALAVAGPRTGLFSGADSDRDGVPDRRDACKVLPENHNGYADDDGCPDHLSALDVVPWIGRTAVTATVTLYRAGVPTVVEAPRVADDLVPGERVRVEVVNGCFEGTGATRIHTGRNELDVVLEAHLDQPVAWMILDPEGQPVSEAVLRFDSVCAPQEPVLLPEGFGTVLLGEGVHAVTVEVPGFEPATRAVDAAEPEIEVILLPASDDDDEDEG